MGTALGAEVDSDPEQLDLLRRLHQRWPFFRMLISKVEMTLSKVDLDLAHHYMSSLGNPEQSEAFEAIFQSIADEYALTLKLVLEITGQQRLLGADPGVAAVRRPSQPHDRAARLPAGGLAQAPPRSEPSTTHQRGARSAGRPAHLQPQ